MQQNKNYDKIATYAYTLSKMMTFRKHITKCDRDILFSTLELTNNIQYDTILSVSAQKWRLKCKKKRASEFPAKMFPVINLSTLKA